MRLITLCLLFVAALCGLGQAHAEPPPNPPTILNNDLLPWSIRLARLDNVPDLLLDTISLSLGAKVDYVNNQHFEVHGGIKLQINALQFVKESDAVALIASENAEASPNLMVRNGRVIYEIISPSPAVALHARYLVGATPSAPAVYQVQGEFAPTTSGESEDYAVSTQLLNASISTPPADLPKVFAPLIAQLNLGPVLSVHFPAGRQRTTTASFDPQPTTQTNTPDGFLQATFDPDKLPNRAGLPFIKFTIQAEVSPSPEPHKGPPSNPSDIASDPVFFPTAAPEIKAILDEALKDLPPDATDAQKLAALHRWTVEHIPHGGPTPGARRPTLDVLASKAGRCFESADVLITLCRAAGIPAHPVVGWVVGLGGHVWVEAQIGPPTPDGLALWQALDATVPWVGLNERYVSLWYPHVPPVYLSLPTITTPTTPTTPKP